jgi:hypothetical protein
MPDIWEEAAQTTDVWGEAEQAFGDTKRDARRAALLTEQTQARGEADAGWLTGAGSNLAEVGGDFTRGVSQLPVGTLRLAGRTAEAANRWAGRPDGQSMFTQAGDFIEGQVNRLPGGDPNSLATGFNQGVGQLSTTIAGGLAARGLGASAATAATVAGTAGFGAEFDDAFNRSVERGDTQDTALFKSLGYASVATGIENMAGAGRVFRQLFPDALKASQKLTALGVSREVAKNFLAGYGEEASQRVAQNLIVAPEQGILTGANQEGLVGALVQGPVASVGTLANAPARMRQTARQGTETPPPGSFTNPLPAEAPAASQGDVWTEAAGTAQPATKIHFQTKDGQAGELELAAGTSPEVGRQVVERSQPGATVIGVESVKPAPVAVDPAELQAAMTANQITPEPATNQEVIADEGQKEGRQEEGLLSTQPAAGGQVVESTPAVPPPDERANLQAELDAELGQKPGKKLTARQADNLSREMDVIDIIQSVVGPIRITSTADYGNLVDSKTGAARGLLSKTRGTAADVALRQLHGEGWLLNLQTEDDLVNAILTGAKGRETGTASAGRRKTEQAMLDDEEATLVKFQELALQNKGRNAVQKKQAKPVDVATLQVGTKFELKGEPFTVTAIDPDTGDVTVQDGRKFGRQVIAADATQFHPDGGKVQESTGGGPNVAPNVEEPFSLAQNKPAGTSITNLRKLIAEETGSEDTIGVEWRPGLEHNGRMVEGWTSRGRAVLNAAAPTMQDEANARQVIREEAAHMKLATAEGQMRLRKFVGRLSPNERRALLEMGYSNNEETLTNEFIAKQARQNTPFWQRLVAHIKAWLKGQKGLREITNEEAARAILRSIRPQATAKRNVVVANNATVVGPALFSLRAYHGTPHKVDRFTTEKIGTGEGAQVYGWGLYFAENQAVAESYAKSIVSDEQVVDAMRSSPEWSSYSKFEELIDPSGYISKEEFQSASDETKQEWLHPFWDDYKRAAIANGNQYTVLLNVEPDELLDWDKPLSEQSEKVRNLLGQLGWNGDVWRGEDVYIHYVKRDGVRPSDGLRGGYNDFKAGSEHLMSLGIRGIRYLDQGSRSILRIERGTYLDGSEKFTVNGPRGDVDFDTRAEAEAFIGVQPKETYNYVIFDESAIEITEENGRPVSIQQASETQFSLSNPNRELNALQGKQNRTAAENAKITQLQNELGQQDLFATPTKSLAELEKQKQRDEIARRQSERLLGGRLETQKGLFAEPGQQSLFSLSKQQRSDNFNAWFRASKVVDANGEPLRVYHGSKRPDRIGNQFKASRATSGPMSFFTADPQMGSKYAEGKRDTSIELPESYAEWFKVKLPGSRSQVTIDRAWWFLDPATKQKLAANLSRVTTSDQDGNELPSGTYRLASPEDGGIASNDSWAYELRQAHGNQLKAAVEIWLSSGSLFNREEEFLSVLQTAGMDVSTVKFDSPWLEFPAVFPVYLKIENPLNTQAIPADVLKALEQNGKRKRAQVQHGADQWDKRSVSGKDWLERLHGDLANGTTHAWTSIPDWVTDTLKAFGYDGIQDVGGKNGGQKHDVWVPFDDRQVKSAIGNSGKFDPAKANITFSLATEEELRRIEAESANKPDPTKQAAPPYDPQNVGKLWHKIAPSSSVIKDFDPALQAQREGINLQNAYQQAAVRKSVETLHQQIEDSLYGPAPSKFKRFLRVFIHKPRLREFMKRSSSIAARLNVVGGDSTGWKFQTFDMRAGYVGEAVAQLKELKEGGMMEVATETGPEFLRVGPLMEFENGKKGHQLFRQVTAETQAEIWQATADRWPELMWVLNVWVDPSLKDAKLTVNGVDVPVFNRWALASRYSVDHPEFNPREAYTPDVAISDGLLGTLRDAGKSARAWFAKDKGLAFNAGIKSPGRKYDTGVNREMGRVHDLVSGFGIRTGQLLRESTAKAWRNAVFKSSKDIPREGLQQALPSGWVRLQDGMSQLFDAVVMLRKFDDPINWPQVDARFNEKSNREDYKRFWGEMLRWSDAHPGSMLPKHVVDSLIKDAAMQVEHGKLWNLANWWQRNAKASMLLGTPTFLTNYIDNYLRFFQFGVRHATMALLHPSTARTSLRQFSGVTYGALVNMIPGVRLAFGLNDQQLYQKFVEQKLPREVWAQNTGMADIDVHGQGVQGDIRGLLAQGKQGKAALRAISDPFALALQSLRYGDIDAVSKSQLVFSSLRGAAVAAAKAKKLKGAAFTSEVERWMLNVPTDRLRNEIARANKFLINYSDSPSWLRKFATTPGSAAVMPFPMYAYHWGVREIKMATAGMRSLYQAAIKGRTLTSQQKAEAWADTISYAMSPAIAAASVGGATAVYMALADSLLFPVLQSMGLKPQGPDDDEDPRNRVGSQSVLYLDDDGEPVRKQMPRDMVLANRLNLSTYARMLGLDPDPSRDYWWKFDQLPLVRSAAAFWLAGQDTRKFGPVQGALTLAEQMGNFLRNVASPGPAPKLVAKTLAEAGNIGQARAAYTGMDPYATGVPLSAYATMQILGTIPGNRQANEITKWLDPVPRLERASKTLDYSPGPLDIAQIEGVTGLASRLYSGATRGDFEATQPPQGTINRKTRQVDNPREFTLAQRIASLAGLNLKPMDAEDYQDRLEAVQMPPKKKKKKGER